jgi:hypothetical protein
MDLQRLAQLDAQRLEAMDCPHGASSQAWCVQCLVAYYAPQQATLPNAIPEADLDTSPGGHE